MNTYEIELTFADGKRLPLMTMTGTDSYVLDTYNMVKGLHEKNWLHPNIKGVTLVRKW